MLRLFAKLFVCAALLAGSGVVAADADDDPWEDYNRQVFAFNEWADTYFVRPVARQYRRVMPREARRGLGNAFDNVLEIRNVFNSLLQGKVAQAGRDTGRFLINSTFGMLGLFDVAQHVGLESSGGEDFSQTLAVWGVNSGPYVVLPFLGPSTLRDTLTMPVDLSMDPLVYIEPTSARNAVRAVELLDTRTRLLELEHHVTGERYTFLRDAYLQRREYLIHDGEIEDSFGADFEGYDDYGEAGDDYDF